MRLLGIDTSCDESSAAILDTHTGRLLADVVHSHVSQMQRFGGIVPEVASREHLKALPIAVTECLSQARLTAKDIDGIAVTTKPGLIGALLVGVSYAKALAASLDIPFFSIDHIEAHLFSPLLGEAPPFPWIALVVSGGHTELFHVKSAVDYQWLGGTVDDAAGEAFDKIGKLLGLAYPAGPVIDKWVANEANDSHRTRFKFPRAKVEKFHFSFSGLKTAVSLKVKELGTSLESEKLAVAAAAQEAILDTLVDKTQEASREFGVNQIVVTGGVACNSRLREKLKGAYFPSPKHCSDNAAMIALLASLYEKKGQLSPAPWETTASAR